MLPILPNEIVAGIIECASFQDKIDDLLLHTYSVRVLKTLCLVSKRFYAFAAPLLYHDVIIRTGFSLQKLIPIFMPLLSREQRRRLRNSAPGEQDWIDRERMVNPLWVRRFILLEAGYAQKTMVEEEFLWRCIEDAVEDMENLQFVCWESKHRSPRLLQTLSRLQRLSHVTSGNTDYLFSPDLEGPQLPPLQSLSVYYLKGLTDEFPSQESLYKVLETSSQSLRELNLSFSGHLPGEAGPAASNAFKKLSTGPHSSTIMFPNVEGLFLTGHEKNIIETLTQMIDFSRLKYLQLAIFNERGCLPKALGQLSLRSLQKISVCLVPSSVVDVLSRCEGLQEIHVTYESDDPKKMSNPTKEVLEAVLKHGSTLRALTLHGAFCNYLPLNSDGFAKLANGCPKLEDLKVNLDFRDWRNIVSEIAKLRLLKHLCLDAVADHSETPFIIEGQQVLTCHGEPWWDSDEEDENHPEGQLSEFDKAIGQLLEASAHHAVSLYSTTAPNSRYHTDFYWRDYSKLRFIKISAPGLNPVSSSEILSQGYLLREGKPTPEFEEDEDAFYHGIRWLAPVGQLYSYSALGVSISLEIAGLSPRSARLWDNGIPVVFAGWDTAFKATSDKAQYLLDNITMMH